MSWLGVGGEKEDDTAPDDKAPPKGALEEAVSLFDELVRLNHDHSDRTQSYFDENEHARLDDLQRRRAALEPRLARRRENRTKCTCDGYWDAMCPQHGEGSTPWRENQGKSRADEHPAPCKYLSDATPCTCEPARRRENQAKPRGDKP